ncbi:peptidase M50 [Caulobacter sp. Root487D2Y]|uniref:site-2 protease family protein n=1 Tax=Caulobacter sp. Root487D2Y TaxID=1736547 RepID=UPI0006FE69BA|nr:site-2 protease family protein [Caulobacter sp. Root487D2Y]KQY27628.1 peptidase M50 [Caulobacter sp. Root487D2Y]
MTLADARPAKPAPISPNALILIVIFTGLAFALARLPDPPGVLTFAFVVAGWILSVSIHEFAHAFVAYKAGDHTIAEKGYLTLDPLKYTDLSTSLILPLLALALGGIGFPGGAVYLRDDLMRSKRGRALASLAGPLGTLTVLIGLAACLAADRAFGVQTSPLSRAAAFLAFLQAFALVLNLLPLPGLDGFGVIRPYLPPEVQQRALKFGNLVFIGLFLAIFLVPAVNDAILSVVVTITDLFGVSRPDIGAGYHAFRFWEG